MNDEPDLASLARTLGDPTRIRMLTLLMEGRALTAKELAYGAGVEPATATGHLRRLQDDLFVSVAAQGRHKYFRIASPQVGQLVESLMAMAPRKTSAAGPLSPIRAARFCYDHLAGQLGTRLSDALLARGLIAIAGTSFMMTPAGEEWFAAFGIDLPSLRNGRRSFAHQCLDWSERRDHLAGALGAALAQRMIERGWIVREPRSRVVTVTAEGELGLRREFGF